jgi:hypothetical protein
MYINNVPAAALSIIMFSAFFEYIGLVVHGMHKDGISKSQIGCLNKKEGEAFLRSDAAVQATRTGLRELARITGIAFPFGATLSFLYAFNPFYADYKPAKELVDCFGTGLKTWQELEHFMASLCRFTDTFLPAAIDELATGPSGQVDAA